MKLAEENLNSAKAAQQRALAHFENLEQVSIKQGEAQLEIWGRKELSDCVHFLPDGAVLVLIGSPTYDGFWPKVEGNLAQDNKTEEFILPLDGRYILLKISPDGDQWTIWNDWIGSIPVFQTRVGKGRIISTLEPIVVAAAGFTTSDIFLPGLISLLTDGNYMSDWTLFRQIKVVPPDCVASWDENSFDWKSRFTVKPSTANWETGWDELVDQMHELVFRAIADVLDTQPVWILPLSGGLDSRLIAAIGAERNTSLFAYTMGPPEYRDVIYAREIAKTLEIPWRHVDLGKDYLVDYVHPWADLFGSAMHFHGMYHYPFISRLKSVPERLILTGFIGDVLSGAATAFLYEHFSNNGKRYQLMPDEWGHWPVDQLQGLLRISINEALEQISGEIENQINRQEGALYQRQLIQILWGRQRHFTYYQSMLCDYFQGVAVPYLNREYARFCLSLPRIALDNRNLLVEVFRRYYGKVAVIPYQLTNEPLLLSGRYLLKRRIAAFMPESIMLGPFRQFNSFEYLTTDVECVYKHGWDAFWPIKDAWKDLELWMNIEEIERIYENANNGSYRAVRQLQSIQAFAYRLQNG